MRNAVALLVTAAALVCTVPATADSNNAGCQAYGVEDIASLAQMGNFGALVSSFATSGPGAVANAAASEKQAFCGP